jgi:hypothetical protein
MKALVEPDGHVADVRETEFPVHPSLQWITIPDGQDVQPGWQFRDGEFHFVRREHGSGGRGGSAYGGDINIGGGGGDGLSGGRGGNAQGLGLNVGGSGGYGHENGGDGGNAVGGSANIGGHGGSSAQPEMEIANSPKPTLHQYLNGSKPGSPQAP